MYLLLIQFPLDKLGTLHIPKSANKSSELKLKNEAYSIQPIRKEDAGELRELKFIAPTVDGYKPGFGFQRMYQISPKVDIATDEDLKLVGLENKSQPYIPREQPSGMKLQSVPTGFNTGTVC
jgi:hypothetical protein